MKGENCSTVFSVCSDKMRENIYALGRREEQSRAPSHLARSRNVPLRSTQTFAPHTFAPHSRQPHLESATHFLHMNLCETTYRIIALVEATAPPGTSPPAIALVRSDTLR
jgi:hypothetical protein